MTADEKPMPLRSQSIPASWRIVLATRSVNFEEVNETPRWADRLSVTPHRFPETRKRGARSLAQAPAVTPAISARLA